MHTQSLLRMVMALLLLGALVPGCGESDSSTAGLPAPASYPEKPRTEFGGNRPVTLQVPSMYDATQPTPLLVVLHGYSATGAVQEYYLRLNQLVESEGILIIAPDGTVDASGNHFWNATDACCDFGHTNVDDVGYILGLIADISHDYNVDRRRIYLIGHSNGAFMSHRLACVAAPQIAAIVSLAGATFKNAADCSPTEPVSILDVHGDADDTVLYAGGDIADGYPGEIETVTHWQVYDHCAPGLVTDPATLDLDVRHAGNETTIQRFEGCARGTGVELWTIHGGIHIPPLTVNFAPAVWQWLSAHPKQ